MTAKLSVNLNAVALLRNRRDLPWPSVTDLGRIALGAGAHGLTVHPRPDERHTRFSDLPDLRNLIDDDFPDAEFNMEGFPEEGFLKLCLKGNGFRVSLFCDPDASQTAIKAAAETGADRIELYTGPYGSCYDDYPI